MLHRPAVDEARPKEASPPLDSRTRQGLFPPSATPPEGLRMRRPAPPGAPRRSLARRAHASQVLQLVGLGCGRAPWSGAGFGAGVALTGDPRSLAFGLGPRTQIAPAGCGAAGGASFQRRQGSRASPEAAARSAAQGPGEDSGEAAPLTPDAAPQAPPRGGRGAPFSPAPRGQRGRCGVWGSAPRFGR